MLDAAKAGATTQADQKRIDEILAQMTLEEKAAMTVGRDSWTTFPVERLGVPSVWVSDGPTGLRKATNAADMSVGRNVPATCFPTESALGASWDVDLVREVGAAIAAECQAEGVQVLLAPGLNLKRSPLCGRNFEYFAEDPILTGEIAAAFVGGLQENGVGGCLKHLVANESETDRMIVSSDVDERTLRELYLRPFEIAVAKVSPWTIMAAYNRLNGVYCCENQLLLSDIVAGEWGYEGVIVSDWVAVNDRVAGIKAGLHLQMPAAPSATAVAAAVREGRLSEARLDEIVRVLLAFVFKADAARRPNTAANLDEHDALARRVVAESVVLLKNEGDLLPLPADISNLAVIGAFAKEPRFQGAGSSQVVPARPVQNIHDELATLLGPGAQIAFAPGYRADGETDDTLLQEARDTASKAGLALVVVGLPGSYEEEGLDRTHLNLPPGHNALVEAVLAAQPRTVVVLINGSAVAPAWAEQAPALLEGWLGGQAGGGGIADVLTGHANPSGKLEETFPMRLEDTPSYLNFPDDRARHVRFGEGLFTGYRWYDARNIAPLFPFGHGLSYTTFEYSEMNAQKTGPDSATVSLRVSNSGGRAGKEVVQLYLAPQNPRLPRPQKELKAFAKIDLQPGEAKLITFELGPRDFAAFDPQAQAWTTAGDYNLLVGSSSRDIRLQASVTLADSAPQPQRLDRLSPISDWLKNPLAATKLEPLVIGLIRSIMGGGEGEIHIGDRPDDNFILGFPISKLIMFGVLSDDEVDQLAQAANA